MKRLFAMILTLAVLLTVAACGGSPEDDAAKVPDQTEKTGTGSSAAQAGKIAVVFATGGLGDKTYNDSLYYGVKSICDAANLQFDYSEPMDAAEYEPLLRGYADAGDYDLIISLGYSQGTSVEAVAPNYPDQNFMLIDAEVACDQVA